MNEHRYVPTKLYKNGHSLAAPVLVFQLFCTFKIFDNSAFVHSTCWPAVCALEGKGTGGWTKRKND